MPAADAPPLTLADLSPANFAIVMATGILSIAAHQQGHEGVAFALLAVNVVAWLAVSGLTAARFFMHRARFLLDLRSHLRAPGFFTSVAGTGVLGGQCLVLGVGGRAAFVLAGVSAVLWVVLTYGIFTALTIEKDKPALDEGISGAWLLAVVATQTLAVLAALIAARLAQPWRLALNFMGLSMWLFGGMLYVWLISLIFYRYVFLRFAPRDLAPTYWINMGAMAISTLGGSLLVLNMPQAPFLEALGPFLKGGTVLYWATGTWWIPLLALLAAWKYLHSRYPLSYEPVYWGAVFPLGMYSAATHQMSLALGLDFLEPVARGFLYVAMAAWVLASAGLLRRVLGRFR
ncbi:MAG: tellurite resistance/C4-dicarboxylate transporter family protein [Pseudomonadota bacterium]